MLVCLFNYSDKQNELAHQIYLTISRYFLIIYIYICLMYLCTPMKYNNLCVFYLLKHLYVFFFLVFVSHSYYIYTRIDRVVYVLYYGT